MINQKIIAGFAICLFGILFMSSFASAGIGIKWGQESLLVNQGTEVCLTYNVYNPWPANSYVRIGVSGEVQTLLGSQEAETKLVPANTASNEALPLKFCFKVPYVYENGRNCLAGSMMCEQKCSGEQKVYSGEVVISEEPQQLAGGGTGGSSALASVSAPLTLKVVCREHGRDYKLVYIIIGIIAIAAIVYFSTKKRKK